MSFHVKLILGRLLNYLSYEVVWHPVISTFPVFLFVFEILMNSKYQSIRSWIGILILSFLEMAYTLNLRL